MDIELLIKKSYVKKSLKTLAFSVVVTLFVGCGKKSNSDLPNVDSYPVAEISEGLAQAAQTYSEVSVFHDSLAIVKGAASYGVIDRNGNLVIPCEYTALEPCGKFFYACQFKNSWGVIDRTGKVLVPCRNKKDDVIVYPNEGYIRCIEKDNYGYYSEPYFIDFNGKRLSAPRYDKSAIFFNGIAMVSKYKGSTMCENFYFIDKQGKEVMKVVKNGDVFGVVDTSGKEVVPFKFKSIDCYDSGYLLVTGMNHLDGIWDIKDGKEIVAPMYGIVTCDNSELGCKTFIKDSIIIVRRGSNYGAINTDGKEIVPCTYGFAQVKNGLVEVTQGEGIVSRMTGVFDQEGNELLKCEYYIVEIDKNSIIAEKMEDDLSSMQTFLYDHKGNLITKVGASGEIRHFSEGMAAVKKDKDKGFGFYDYDGDEVIAPRYEDAGIFSEGLAPVKLNGKWGYVNRKGVDTFGNR